MPDREKVIKGLALVREHLWYQAEQNKQYKHYYAELDSTVLDAINLLKEQEEKQTPKPIVKGHMEEYWGEEEICPDCGKRWQSADIDTTRFCPGCGRAVKWE